MLLDRIESYEIFRPKCDPSKEVLHGIATLKDDISPVFPYLNAELGGWDYDQKNQVVLLKLSAGKWSPCNPTKSPSGAPGTRKICRSCRSGSKGR
jgi:hypothetical protein